MRILVTGGAGFIGSHTCLELLNNGYEVIVLDNLSNSGEESLNRVKKITGKKLTFYKVDLLDLNAVKDVFSKESIDAVIHFAGLKAVGESVEIPLDYYSNNITGTLNLCYVMKEYNVKKIVFSSSATVYGDPDRVPITEDMKLQATNPYGRTKLFLEYILKDLYVSDKSFAVSILRYFNPVGAHESGMIGENPNGIPNNLMPRMLNVAAGKWKALTVYGDDYDTADGTGVRDYIHIKDLVAGHLKALELLNTHKGVHLHNLGTGTGYSVLDIVKAFEKATGIKIPCEITPRRPGDVAECYADVTKAEKELGFKASYSLEQMCKDAWNWQSKNPNGY